MATLQEQIDAINEIIGEDPAGVYADIRVRLDILEARINNPNAPAPNVTNPFYIDGYGGVSISVGDGYPTENRVNGSMYLRRDGYIYEGLYLRRNSNWASVNVGFVDWSYFSVIRYSDGYLYVESSCSQMSINIFLEKVCHYVMVIPKI